MKKEVMLPFCGQRNVLASIEAKWLGFEEKIPLKKNISGNQKWVDTTKPVPFFG